MNYWHKKNEYLQEAVSGVRQLTEEEIRQRCHAREDYYIREHINKRLDEKELAERDEALQQMNKALQQKDAQLTAALARIAELEATKNK